MPIDYKHKKYGKINRFRRDAVLNFITKSNAAVLDIGCGDGELGAWIKRHAQANIHGIDISEASMEAARSKLDKVFCFDIENDKWPEEIKNTRYNYMIISEVLEHLYYPENLMKDIFNFIKEDTEIIISVPNILFWRNRISLLSGKFEYSDKGLMDRGHIHFFSWESLRKMVENNGFIITDENHHIPTKWTKFIGTIFPGLFAYQFIFKIKRR